MTQQDKASRNHGVADFAKRAERVKRDTLFGAVSLAVGDERTRLAFSSPVGTRNPTPSRHSNNDTKRVVLLLSLASNCGCRLLAKAPMRSPSALAHNLQTQHQARHPDATGGKENVPPATRGEGWVA